MDIFNYGEIIRNFMFGLFRGLRKTGRTTRLMEQMKSGDVLITSIKSNSKYSDMMKRIAKEHGKNITVIQIDPNRIYDILHYPSLRGKIYSHGTNFFYDHLFLEDYYENVLLNADKALKETQDILQNWCVEPRSPQNNKTMFF